ncbi:ATP-binding cassette domain-containing protein [Apilactobacillus quenuiae]|uniref:ATP-binding cassette domain-containing protein n=1 Tax=Apilactobacillus quenuiae TaxID=2008377 RepID=UPI000D019BE3|nr:ABC transporter ATP-binding protein [Apilactobacillus quenuiae]
MKNINKTIKNKVALSNANLNINNNEICALIGPNGAGKTTLIKCLTGLSSSDSGIIKFDNESLNNRSINDILSKIGAVLKFPESISKTPIESIFNQEFFYRGIKQHKSVNYYLNKVKLNVSPDTKAGKLSLGMKQRLLIALAISHNPSLLILDEPFNGLDVDGVDLMKNIISDFVKENNNSVLITSHSLNDLNDFVSSVTFMQSGHTLHKETMEDIRENYGGSIKDYYREVHNNEL